MCGAQIIIIGWSSIVEESSCCCFPPVGEESCCRRKSKGPWRMGTVAGEKGTTTISTKLEVEGSCSWLMVDCSWSVESTVWMVHHSDITWLLCTCLERNFYCCGRKSAVSDSWNSFRVKKHRFCEHRFVVVFFAIKNDITPKTRFCWRFRKKKVVA